MLHLAPKRLPSFLQCVESLGNPHPYSIAQALGVDERTVRRWLKTGRAPAPVLLALYWLTPFGQSALDAELHTRATLYGHLSRALRDENATLTRENTLLRLGITQRTDEKKPAHGGPLLATPFHASSIMC